MIKEAIEKILDLGKPERIFADPGSRFVVQGEMHLIQYPLPKPLTVHTLTGVVDYLAKVDEHAASTFIHIEDYNSVSVVSRIMESTAQRACLMSASAKHCMHGFSFGKKYDVENFIIALQANFVQDEVTTQILKIVSSMKAEKVTQADDNGITQQVTARAGVVMSQQVAIPNPVVLRPYRTFTEIEQPEGSFVLRVHQQGSELPSVSLTETENSAWKTEAIHRISEFFASKISSIKVVA